MLYPKITILTTTLNSEKTISACIESVGNQTYGNFEHIIIDGLSNDHTVSIIEEYRKSYPRLSYISDKDNGVYNAMNKGISLSSGEWILFLGSDDRLYDDNVLETVFSEKDFTGKEFVYGNVRIDGDSGWAKDGEIYGGEFDLSKILIMNICQQSVFYRRSVFNVIGLFNERYRVCADWDFNIHCFAKFGTAFVDVIIANFSGGGVSYNTVDYNFSNDLPGNVIEYFGLDPDDIQFRNRKSPFYNIVLQFHKKKYPVEYFLYLAKQKLKAIF